MKLQSEYNFDKFNFVGHSMGNLTFAQYMMTYDAITATVKQTSEYCRDI
ncbi:alpha/beta hydrolase [Staphylococcus aureus]